MSFSQVVDLQWGVHPEDITEPVAMETSLREIENCHNSSLGSCFVVSYLTIIELTMWPCVWLCVWQPTPKTADVTVTKIAGYDRVRLLMNRRFFRIFGIHSFYATSTLLNI